MGEKKGPGLWEVSDSISLLAPFTTHLLDETGVGSVIARGNFGVGFSIVFFCLTFIWPLAKCTRGAIEI